MSALRTLAFLVLVAVSSSQTSDCSYMSLLDHFNLRSSDNVLSVMRPVKNWTVSTSVYINMVLYGMLELDEKLQTVTSHIWIQMAWRNEFLTWNPAEFCNMDVLTVPRSMLWVPDVYMQEDASDTGSIQNAPLLSVYSHGLIMSTSRQRLTSTCHLNLFLFPFDTQFCNFTFASMSSEEKFINLRSMGNDSSLEVSEQLMITAGEWQLMSMEVINLSSVQKKVAFSKLIYMVTIFRKPLLYVINLIVPLVYLLILDLASFFISEGRGEKLSFKVTVLLSISVFMLILKDILPSTEDSLPMIANYSVVIFTLVGLSVLEAMLVSFLIDLDGYRGKKAQSSTSVQVDVQIEDEHCTEPVVVTEKGESKPEKSDQPLDLHLLKLILEEVQATRQHARRQDEDKRKPGRYTKLAEIIDTVFFCLYFLTVVMFLAFMFSWWIPKDYFT